MRTRERIVRYLLKRGNKIGLSTKTDRPLLVTGGIVTTSLLGWAFYQAVQNNLIERPLYWANMLMFTTFWLAVFFAFYFLNQLNKLKKNTWLILVIMLALGMPGVVLLMDLAVENTRSMWFLFVGCGGLALFIIETIIYKLVTNEIKRGSIVLDDHGKPILD